MEGLEEFLAHRFDAVIAIEIGGHDIAVAICTAAAIGVPVVAADPAGRSVPGAEHTTYSLCGVSIAPMCVATEMGDVLVIPRAAGHERVETIARALPVASGGSVGVARPSGDRCNVPAIRDPPAP